MMTTGENIGAAAVTTSSYIKLLERQTTKKNSKQIQKRPEKLVNGLMMAILLNSIFTFKLLENKKKNN